MFVPVLVMWLTCPKVPRPSLRWRGRGLWPAPWTPATSPPGWPSRSPVWFPRRPPSLRRRGSGQTQQVLKGTIACDVFFAHLIMSGKVIYDLSFVGFWSKICRNWLSFTSIDIFSIYGKNYWRILFIRLYSLSVFSVRAKIMLAYLETTSLKYSNIPLKRA